MIPHLTALPFLSPGAEGDPDAEERERDEEMQRRRAEEEVSQLAPAIPTLFTIFQLSYLLTSYPTKEEEMSEREAARMLERMRATEEDEEFERAFRSMVRSSSVRVRQRVLALLHFNPPQRSLSSYFLVLAGARECARRTHCGYL